MEMKYMVISDKIGFTLIELIIVVIIIGILAAIATPMMGSNIMRAKQSEVMATLGVIRSAERQYYVEYASYVTVTPIQWDTSPLSIYINASSLNGRYVFANAYSVAAAGAAYTITCNSTEVSGAPGCGGEDLGVFTMDQSGATTYLPPA
jgi:prepilin-type N-terminal cleavage/methylation domain-containing protein